MRPTISQTAFAFTFVPFALLLSIALLAAEQADSLDHARLLYSSWVSLVFATPALCLYVFPRTRDGEYELLAWTFSYSAYLVHFYYAFGVTYGGSFARTYASQGPVIATSNFALTALWTFDVVANWAAPRNAKWHEAVRLAARTFAFTIFVVSAVVIFGGFVRVLGVTMIAAVACCLIVRVVTVLRERTQERGEARLAADVGAS
jgi:hypothetical protein